MGKHAVKQLIAKKSFKVSVYIFISMLSAFVFYSLLHLSYVGRLFPNLHTFAIMPLRHWVVFTILTTITAIVMFFVIFKPALVSRIYEAMHRYVDQNIINIVGEESDGRSLNNSNFMGLFKQSRFYWIWVSLTAVLCYGYTLANPSIGIDDVVMLNYIESRWILRQGRWGSHLLRYFLIETHPFLPLWRCFIGLILLILGLTLFCGLYQKYSNHKFNDKAATIFTCAAISFPWIAHLFIFAGATIEIGLIVLLTGISLFFATKWIIEKRHFTYIIPSALTLGYATAFYENAMVLFLFGSFTILFLSNLFTVKNGKLVQFIIMSAKTLLIVVFGMLFWRLGAIFLQFIFSVDSVDYTGALMAYDTTGINEFFRSLTSALESFLHNGLISPRSSSLIYVVLLVASLIIIITSIIFAILLKNPTVFFSGIIATGSAYGLTIVTGNLNLFLRTQWHLLVLAAFALALLFLLLHNISFKKIKLKYFTLFLIVWVVIAQSREINHLFYLDNQRYQRDVMIMNTIIHDLGGAVPEKPVLFVGTTPNPISRIELTGLSIFDFSHIIFPHSQAPFDGQLRNFFRHHNFPIVAPSRAVVDIDELRYIADDMQSWANDGYIKELEDFIVIKIGPWFP